MQLIVRSDGDIYCLYDEALDLAAFGRLTISRASHVEPIDGGQWMANLAPQGGPLLGPFAWRSFALAAEQAWLERHRLR